MGKFLRILFYLVVVVYISGCGGSIHYKPYPKKSQSVVEVSSCGVSTIEEAKKATVKITSTNSLSGTKQTGTGFVIAKKPNRKRVYIVTAAHVITGDLAPKVQFSQTGDFYNAIYKLWDSFDVAVLWLDLPPNIFSQLPTHCISEVRLEKWNEVFTYGFSEGYWREYARMDFTLKEGNKYIFDGNIREGFSGGPLLLKQNDKFQVVAMVKESTRTEVTAVPAQTIRNLIRQLELGIITWMGQPSQKKNTPPVAKGDQASTKAGTTINIPILDNDNDPDGDELTITNYTQPKNGRVNKNRDNTFTYTPKTGFSGTDSFTYTISDGNSGENIAKVAIYCVNPASLQERLAKVAHKETTTIERYPTIECRDRVPISQEFSVKVSLTEDLITPQVTTKPSKKTGEHSKAMVLKKGDKGKVTAFILSNQMKISTATNGGQDAWEIEVELSAPAFNFRGSDIATITLPLHGNSDIARFRLTPKPIKTPVETHKIYALLWHKDVYLARIAREITVTNQSRLRQTPAPRFPSTGLISGFVPPSSSPKLTPRDEKQAFNLGLQSPDMTVYFEHKISRISVHSNRLKRLAGSLAKVDGLSKWLNDNYGNFTRAGQKVVVSITNQGSISQLERKRNVALMKGFGRHLYDKYAPEKFKKAFWALKDKFGDEFNTIHIFTDDPIIPWELMIPSRGNEELDFLGIDFQIARWHISENQELERPLQSLNLQKLFAIMPEYPDDNLAMARNELEMLQTMTGFRRVGGNYNAFSKLFKTSSTDNSIIHFSGHGIVQDQRYAIKLEDGELDLMTFRGIIPRPPKTHPLFFFNACDIGQAHHVANFVDGWAPTVLEAGASGYIGGLWPLTNIGATKFAELFYQKLEKSLAGQPTNVADILRQTRKHFYDNGDPTFLGYVYYGDPHFRLVR